MSTLSLIFRIRCCHAPLTLWNQTELPINGIINVSKVVGLQKNLYSGTFKRFDTQFPSLLQRSSHVTSPVPHNIVKNRLVKVWKHTQLPLQSNV